jgi:hypothetical protein
VRSVTSRLWLKISRAHGHRAGAVKTNLYPFPDLVPPLLAARLQAETVGPKTPPRAGHNQIGSLHVL